ncbi:MAG: hypothetical protein ACFFC3_08630 [Candidatus Odinarchaeota archaeon]
MKKRNLENIYMIFLIVLTNLIGFTFYIISAHGDVEIEFLENVDDFSDIDEFIKNESEAEFQDEIEEIIEEEVEDIIETIIEVPEIRIL